jgi:1,4-dihydroxy-2-naphthoate octaprenyltransferase
MSVVTGQSPGRPVAQKLVGYAQLAKLRVYQHLYEWLIAALLLWKEEAWRDGTAVALALALLGMVAVQAAACAADDIMGFRDGSDAENYAPAAGPALGQGSNNVLTQGRRLPKPLLSGALSEREAVVFAAGAVVVALGSLAGMAIALGGRIPVAMVIAGLVVVACAVQYSWGLRLSYRPGGLELVIFVVNVGSVLLPYWGLAGEVTATVVLLSVLAGVWFLLLVSYGNAADRDGDAAAGRRTLAVAVSPGTFRGILVGLHVVAVGLAVVPFALGLLEPVLVLCLVPLFAGYGVQAREGLVRGDLRKAMRIGFRCIDLAGIGFAVAIALS